MTLSWDILYQEGQYYNFWRRKCSISCAARELKAFLLYYQDTVAVAWSKTKWSCQGHITNFLIHTIQSEFILSRFILLRFFSPMPLLSRPSGSSLACDDQSEVLGIRVLSLFLSLLNIRAKDSNYQEL